MFMETALTGDELVVIARTPVLERYRRIVYHRREYANWLEHKSGRPHLTP